MHMPVHCGMELDRKLHMDFSLTPILELIQDYSEKDNERERESLAM